MEIKKAIIAVVKKNLFLQVIFKKYSEYGFVRLINQIIVTKDIDIGVNYRPGNSLSSDELDLALSKQLFNNRLVIDGNFGVTNSTTNTKTTNNSNLIGDVTLEYKLTESGRYRVKAFNRSNDNTQVLNSGGPFTQGIGIFYREEFESLSELYYRYLSKIKKKNP